MHSDLQLMGRKIEGQTVFIFSELSKVRRGTEAKHVLTWLTDKTSQPGIETSVL